MTDKQETSNRVKQIMNEATSFVSYTKIANMLNQEHYLTVTGRAFSSKAVSTLMLEEGLRKRTVGKEKRTFGDKTKRQNVLKRPEAEEARILTPLEILTVTLAKNFPNLSAEDIPKFFALLDENLISHPKSHDIEFDQEDDELGEDDIIMVLKAIMELDVPFGIQKIILKKVLA